jgi:hypothetical protein
MFSRSESSFCFDILLFLVEQVSQFLLTLLIFTQIAQISSNAIYTAIKEAKLILIIFLSVEFYSFT